MKAVIYVLLAFMSLQAGAQSLENKGAGATVPAYRVQDISPNDSFSFPQGRAIWIGSGGDVRVLTAGGDEVTIVGVPTGTLLPISVTKILFTGTTATSIQVWW
jgi:hypothetical protein